MPSSRDEPTDSPEVRARLVEAMALVPEVAKSLQVHLRGRARHDDLASYGNEGALLAARTYDEGYGVVFRRWAVFKIRASMIDALRTESDLPRRLYDHLRSLGAACSVREGMMLDEAAAPPGSPAAADARIADRLAAMATAYAAGMLMDRGPKTLEALVDPEDSPEQAAAREEMKAALRAAVAERPDAERALLEKYYFEEKTMAEAAGGLSRSWASRLHARAIRGVAISLRRTLPDP